MQTFKAIIGGALIGAAFFFIPFIILRIFLFVLVIGTLIRLFGGRRWGRGFGPGNRIAFADNIRNMSEEEYTNFKQNFQQNCGWNRTAQAAAPQAK